MPSVAVSGDRAVPPLRGQLLDDAERARLKDLVRSRAPVVDAGRLGRLVAFVATVVVWTPVLWSASRSVDEAVIQEVVALALAAFIGAGAAMINGFARRNAEQRLREDRVEALLKEVDAAQGLVPPRADPEPGDGAPALPPGQGRREVSE